MNYSGKCVCFLEIQLRWKVANGYRIRITLEGEVMRHKNGGRMRTKVRTLTAPMKG